MYVINWKPKVQGRDSLRLHVMYSTALKSDCFKTIYYCSVDCLKPSVFGLGMNQEMNLLCIIGLDRDN